MSAVGMHLDVDGRADLAGIAARRERENRPTALIVVTTLGFIAALIYLVIAVLDLRSAQHRLEQRRNASTQVVELAGEITALRQRAANVDEGAAQIGQIRSRLIAIAQEAGVTSRIVPPQDRYDRGAKSVRHRFEFASVTNSTLPPLLHWLNKAVEEIPGLEVYSVSIKPGTNAWMMSVSFARWEKPS